MAVVSVDELFEQRRTIRKIGKVTHTRIWLVECDDPDDGTAVASEADGIPVAGVEMFAGCVAATITASPRQGSDLFFEVQVEYETPTIGTVAIAENPLDRDWEISWAATESTSAYFYDNSPAPDDYDAVKFGAWPGFPVTNSAGEPFENFLERDASKSTITIIRNQATFDLNVMDDYKHTTNSNPVKIGDTTFTADTLKLSPATAQGPLTEKIGTAENPTVVTYYKVTLNLKVDKSGWKQKITDTGYQQLIEITPATDPKTYKLIPILDSTGAQVKRPYPLDGFGKKRPNPTDPAFELEFLPCKSKDWAPIDLTAPSA